VVWKDWRRALCMVHPDTVVRWQRERFRRFWANLSKKSAIMGRPPISREVRTLIGSLALSNRLWRAPRIHGELQKLGIEVSERTVSRVLRTIKRPPSQNWKTFLHNHIGEIVSADFFTVPTLRRRVLFVFVVLAHPRRKVLHFGVTEHPTAEWVGRQLLEAFGEVDAPRYLIHDRDRSYGHEFRLIAQSLGIREIATAPRSPWQNAFVERLIGSIRRECLDHVVFLNRRHLARLLKRYFAYYHDSRTHQVLREGSLTQGLVWTNRRSTVQRAAKIVTASITGISLSSAFLVPTRGTTHNVRIAPSTKPTANTSAKYTVPASSICMMAVSFAGSIRCAIYCPK